jgi:hypothetical protein
MLEGTETATTAVALLLVSATLVATTWKVPADAGAVYCPEPFTLPPPDSCTDQVTRVDWPELVPVTVAVKLTVPPVVVEALGGAMLTEIAAGWVTVTVAVALLVVSATLVATTWKVPADAGAVYCPEPFTLPPPDSWTDQVTAVD